MFEVIVRNSTEADLLEQMENAIEERQDLELMKEVERYSRMSNLIDEALMGESLGLLRPINQLPFDDVNFEELLENINLEHQQDQQIGIEIQEWIEDEIGFRANNDFEIHGGERSRFIPSDLVSNAMDAKARRRLTEDQFHHEMHQLNRMQHTILINVLNLIKLNQPFYKLVLGESGTGKSRLIKMLYQVVEQYLLDKDPEDAHKDRVILCAFTGSAAFNINGVTIHHAFKFNRNCDIARIGKSTLDELKKKYAKVALIIADEMSMIELVLFTWMSKRLQQVFGNALPFGGKSVTLLGDFNQLPPPSGNKIFKVFVEGNAYQEIVTGGEVNELWNYFRMTRLTEIMRQQNDLEFARALSTLGRFGLLGLNDREVNLFNSRIVQYEDIPFNDPNRKVIFLYRTNAKKDAQNNETYKMRQGTDEFVNIAKHVPIAPNGGQDLDKARHFINSGSVVNVDPEKCMNLLHSLQLKVDIQYMITSNLGNPFFFFLNAKQNHLIILILQL